MSFIAVAAAGLAAVSAGSSLYNQYKQGKTLADTDWSGMAGDVMDSYRDNLSNLKDSADVVFDKIEEGWKQGAMKMGDTATTLWAQGEDTTSGLANFGVETYQAISEKFDIERNADFAAKNRDLAEKDAQLDFEAKELALTEDMEQQMAEFEGSEKSSDKWYPGKYLGKGLKKLFG